MSQFHLSIWYLNIAATIVLLFRLAGSRLLRTYHWLSLYLFVDLTESLVNVYFARTRQLDHYAQTYMIGQAIKMILAVFVLLELYRLALESQPAIARFGQKTVGYALAVTAVIAALGLVLDRAVPKDQSKILHRYFSVERTMDVWALFFLLLATAFLLWFPVKLMRNTVFYLVGFMMYFGARSTGLLVMNLLTLRYAPGLDTAMQVVLFGCLLAWIVAVRRQNDDRATVLGHRWNAQAMVRLSAQLDAINANLLRFSRR